MAGKVTLNLEKVKSTGFPTWGSKFLYWLLCSYTKPGVGRAVITRKLLSKQTGFHVDRISRYLEQLRKMGLVTTVFLGRGGMKVVLPEYAVFKPTPGKYTTVPRTILKNRRIKAICRYILIIIGSCAYKGRRFKSRKTFLSKLSYLSSRTISRYTATLRGLGLLKVVRRKFLCNVYRVSYKFHTFLKKQRSGNPLKNKNLPEKHELYPARKKQSFKTKTNRTRKELSIQNEFDILRMVRNLC